MRNFVPSFGKVMRNFSNILRTRISRKCKTNIVNATIHQLVKYANRSFIDSRAICRMFIPQHIFRLQVKHFITKRSPRLEMYVYFLQTFATSATNLFICSSCFSLEMLRAAAGRWFVFSYMSTETRVFVEI